MNLNPLSKISIGQITITTDGTALKFSYNLQEYNKEIQIAAGKIHLGIAKQNWKIEATTISLTIPKEENKQVTFEEIKNLFTEMVTA